MKKRKGIKVIAWYLRICIVLGFLYAIYAFATGKATVTTEPETTKAVVQETKETETKATKTTETETVKQAEQPSTAATKREVTKVSKTLEKDIKEYVTSNFGNTTVTKTKLSSDETGGSIAEISLVFDAKDSKTNNEIVKTFSEEIAAEVSQYKDVSQTWIIWNCKQQNVEATYVFENKDGQAFCTYSSTGL